MKLEAGLQTRSDRREANQIEAVTANMQKRAPEFTDRRVAFVEAGSKLCKTALPHARQSRR